MRLYRVLNVRLFWHKYASQPEMNQTAPVSAKERKPFIELKRDAMIHQHNRGSNW